MHVKLKVILPTGVSYDWSHEGRTLSIGRDPDCDLAIEDREDRLVSWMHARIEYAGDMVLIRDFRSKNGTYVNDEPVEGTQPLRIGDTIHLGRKGPKLIALELDPHQDNDAPASPSAAAVAPARVGWLSGVKAWRFHERRWIVGAAVAAAIVVLLLLGNLMWPRSPEIVASPPPSSAAPPAPPAPHSPPENKAAARDSKPASGLTAEELQKRYSGAVVWLGAEFDQRRLPLCSGFAVARTKIVCTAREIVQLKSYHQEGKPVFVYCETSSPKFLRVVELKVHSAYDPQNPTSSASLLHNVGVAIVESPLPAAVDLLPSRELPQPPTDVEVTAAGYCIQYEPEFKPYDPLDPPKPSWPSGQVRGTKTFSGGGGDLPLLELAIRAPDGLDGGPVFSHAGKVVGVLLRYGGQRYVVLADQFSDLLH